MFERIRLSALVCALVTAGLSATAPAAFAGGAHGDLEYTGSISAHVASSDGPESRSETTISLSWSAKAEDVQTGGKTVDWSFSSLQGSISSSTVIPGQPVESCDGTLSKGPSAYSPSYYQQLESEPTVTVKTSSPVIPVEVLASSDEGVSTDNTCSASAVIETMQYIAHELVTAKETSEYEEYGRGLGIEGKVPTKGTHLLPGNAKVSFHHEESGAVQEITASISSALTVTSSNGGKSSQPTGTLPGSKGKGPKKGAEAKQIAEAEREERRQLASELSKQDKAGASFAKLLGKAGVPSTLSESQSAAALEALKASLAKHGISASKLTSLAGADALTSAPLDVFSTLAHPAG